MAAGLFLMFISLGAIVAGTGYRRTARRMRGFATTKGRIVERKLGLVTSQDPEPRFGQGGNHFPAPTYTYEVGGTAFTSDRYGYARRGLKKRIAERQLAAMPDEIDVHYDPADPGECYLVKHSPGIGTALVAGGVTGLLLGLLILLV
jgi:hypothetical protein